MQGYLQVLEVRIVLVYETHVQEETAESVEFLLGVETIEKMVFFLKKMVFLVLVGVIFPFIRRRRYHHYSQKYGP